MGPENIEGIGEAIQGALKKENVRALKEVFFFRDGKYDGSWIRKDNIKTCPTQEIINLKAGIEAKLRIFDPRVEVICMGVNKRHRFKVLQGTGNQLVALQSQQGLIFNNRLFLVCGTKVGRTQAHPMLYMPIPPDDAKPLNFGDWVKFKRGIRQGLNLNFTNTPLPRPFVLHLCDKEAQLWKAIGKTDLPSGETHEILHPMAV